MRGNNRPVPIKQNKHKKKKKNTNNPKQQFVFVTYCKNNFINDEYEYEHSYISSKLWCTCKLAAAHMQFATTQSVCYNAHK